MSKSKTAAKAAPAASTALTTLDFAGVQTRKTDLTKYSSSASFLRRLQLVGKGKYVDNGQVKPGNYGVPTSAEECTDLGNAVDILPLAVRSKVLDTNPEVPVAVYDENHDEYKRIMDEAVNPDTGKVVKNSGCMFGPSFLVFERSTNEFYEMFMGNASGREEAKRIEPFLPIGADLAQETGAEVRGPLPCTMKSKYVERKFKWWAPMVVKCSEDFDGLPDTTMDQIKKFMEATIEGEDEEAETGERAR